MLAVLSGNVFLVVGVVIALFAILQLPAMPTLLDIAKANGSDGLVGLIDETVKSHPELALVPARPIKGLNYKTLVCKSLGRTTGSFRTANAGSVGIAHTFENKLVEAYMLEARFEIDKMVADGYEDGAQAFIALNDSLTMEGEMQGLASQFYYGTSNHASGYPGLIASYDATNMVVDAGGTTASTGSSVWFVRFGQKDVQWVWGNEGKITFSPLRIESIVDPNDATKKFEGYVHVLSGRPGVQVGSQRSIVRIKKLTADSGKGLTDALINTALAKFPVGFGPDAVFMTQRSGAQLQSSRTATTPTGASAQFPTNIVGLDGRPIPIALTEAILNTESLTL